MDPTDDTTFTNGVFTHEPAMVYNDLDQLLSDLTPAELKKWSKKIKNMKETMSIGMVARFFPMDDLNLMQVEGRSLEEDEDKFHHFFGGEEGFRAEHLTEITIEQYQDSPPNSDQYEIYQYALEYKERLVQAYNRIHLEMHDEPIHPEDVCGGLARMTGFDMPVLGCSPGASSPCDVVQGVSPSDTLPKGVRHKHSVVSPDDIDTKMSKAKI